MDIKSIRFCEVHGNSSALRETLKTAGFSPREGVAGGDVFGTLGDSWIELWDQTPDMPAGIMLQIIVEDAQAWADQARERGVEIHGPFDAHGERMFMLGNSTGMQITVQSKIQNDP